MPNTSVQTTGVAATPPVDSSPLGYTRSLSSSCENSSTYVSGSLASSLSQASTVGHHAMNRGAASAPMGGCHNEAAPAGGKCVSFGNGNGDDDCREDRVDFEVPIPDGGGGGGSNDGPRVTPTPVRQLTIVGIVLLSEAMNCSALFPFVGLYVGHLTGRDVNSTGYISGVVIGLFTFGQLLTAALWGFLSDTYGRKVPMLVGLAAGSVAALAFGLSPNFLFCCIFRLIHGSLCGTVMISRTTISDLSDATNEAKGFAVISLTWGLGTLLGPAAGGLLYDPLNNDKMRWLHVEEGSFLARFPALLPSVFLSIYSAFATVVCVLYLDETNPRAKSMASMCPRLARALGGWCPGAVRGTGGTAASDVVVVTVPDKGGATEKPEADPKQGHQEMELDVTDAGEALPIITYKEAFRDPIIRRVIILVVCLGVSDTAYEETLPLWAIATRSVGGLEMFADGISVIIMTYSVPTILANVFFDAVCKWFVDQLFLLRFSAFWLTALTVVIPFGSQLSERGGFWYVVGVGVARQVVLSWAFGLLSMFTARCAPTGCVGTLFGITQSASCFARCLVPVIATPLFAWSVDESRASRPFPTNHYFVFLLCGLFTLVDAVLSYFVTFDGRPSGAPDNGRTSDPSGSPAASPVRKGAGAGLGAPGAFGKSLDGPRRRAYATDDRHRNRHRHNNSGSDADGGAGATSVMQSMVSQSFVTSAASLNASFAQGAAVAVSRLHAGKEADERDGQLQQRLADEHAATSPMTSRPQEDERQALTCGAIDDEELPV